METFEGISAHHDTAWPTEIRPRDLLSAQQHAHEADSTHSSQTQDGNGVSNNVGLLNPLVSLDGTERECLDLPSVPLGL